MRKMLPIVAAAALAVPTMADTIHISSNHAESPNPNSYGGFEGTLTFDDLGGGLARIAIMLENTSSFDGWLTSLAFDAAAGTSGFSFDAGASSGLGAAWSGLAGPISTAPFGSRASGASISADWEGGDNPHDGLAAGATATWVFHGSVASSGVSAADFLSPHGGNNLVVRFRGFSNGASDKLPGQETPAVPGIGGLATLAAVGCARRRRR